LPSGGPVSVPLTIEVVSRVRNLTSRVARKALVAARGAIVRPGDKRDVALQLEMAVISFARRV
jgi:hypothetical protein